MVVSRGTPETIAGRYRMLRRIGESAAGETWEALDTRLDRTVLLRVLPPHARGDEATRARLRQAARQPTLEASADSPRVLDGGEDPVVGPFVVAELAGAQDRTQPLPITGPYARDFVPAPYAREAAPTRHGLLALLLLLVVILASAVFIARTVFAPTDSAPSPTPVPSVATAPVARTEPTPAPPAGATVAPTSKPAAAPTTPPTQQPTAAPTSPPTQQPTAAPTPAPTQKPAAAPTTAPTQKPAAAPASPPTAVPAAAAGAAASGSPVATIRQHYALISARNYAAGYQLMDSHLQSLNSPADYASWFANKVSIQPLSIDLVSQSDGQAVVRSTVNSTDRVNGQDVTTQVSEQFVLVNENGAWRIDQVKRL